MQFEYFIPICVLKSPYWILFGLFDSPCAVIGPHMREGVNMISILNANLTSLNF